MGFIPVIIEGQRTHHYDIKLDYEDYYIFSGFFNGNGTLGILFTPPAKKEEISSDFEENLKSVYLQIIGVLVQNGMSDKIELDWINKKKLKGSVYLIRFHSTWGILFLIKDSMQYRHYYIIIDH